MGFAVRIVDTALRVVPGAEVGTEVRIRNTGHLVDQADLAVLGEAAAWARVEPPRVNLLPGQEDTVRVVFAPPRAHDVAAGPRPFAVRAASREDPPGSAAEEGTLTVAEFELVVAELVPRTSRAPRAGRHQLAVDNLSNHQLKLRLMPSDPDALLEFRLDATEFLAQPGTATFVKVRARPTTRFLRGAERQIPFQVAVSTPGSDPVVAPGTVRQNAILPAWIFRMALLVALLAALWVGLLKPRLHAKVRDVAEAEAVRASAPLAPKVNQLAEQDAAEKAAEAAASASPTPSPSISATPTATASPTATRKPTPKPAPVPVPLPPPPLPPEPEPTPQPSPEPTPTPPPTRPTNFYKAGWAEQGVVTRLGPDMPTRPETVVRVSKIAIHNPYGDVATVNISGITNGQGETEIQFDGQRRLEVPVQQPAIFDADTPIRVTVYCRQRGEANPGPPFDPEQPNSEVSACLFYVFFNGTTEAPPAERENQPPPPPFSPTPPPQPATFSRRAEF